MDDALRMRRLERVGKLDADLDDVADLERPLVDAIAEVLALERLHDDEGCPLVLADIEDGADSRMAQRAGGARLDPKAIERLTILDGVGGEKLQRDLAAEPLVLGEIDDAHAARTEGAQDTIM